MGSHDHITEAVADALVPAINEVAREEVVRFLDTEVRDTLNQLVANRPELAPHLGGDALAKHVRDELRGPAHEAATTLQGRGIIADAVGELVRGGDTKAALLNGLTQAVESYAERNDG